MRKNLGDHGGGRCIIGFEVALRSWTNYVNIQRLSVALRRKMPMLTSIKISRQRVLLGAFRSETIAEDSLEPASLFVARLSLFLSLFIYDPILITLKLFKLTVQILFKSV